jgi:hypothetical protein
MHAACRLVTVRRARESGGINVAPWRVNDWRQPQCNGRGVPDVQIELVLRAAKHPEFSSCVLNIAETAN